MLSLRDWGRDCMCAPGQDDTCGHRFDGQYGELPHGYDHKYVYSHFGYNLKVTDMQAAIGVAQLKKLPAFAERRRHNYERLRSALDGVNLILPEPCPDSDPCWFGFPMTCGEGVSRIRVVEFLESKRIQTRMLFAGNLIKNPCFDEMRRTGIGYRQIGELPVTDKIMNETFLVGVYPGMDDDMIDYMAKMIMEAVG
jgi:CDP-6-deoxy-D-xylo-4-hexulose-3-dehydrase